MLPMIAEAEAAGADWRLLYGGRQRASMAFLDELAAYGDRVTSCPQDEMGMLDLESVLGSRSRTRWSIAAARRGCSALSRSSARLAGGRASPGAVLGQAAGAGAEARLDRSSWSWSAPG